MAPREDRLLRRDGARVVVGEEDGKRAGVSCVGRPGKIGDPQAQRLG
jgi:hypothetical protein